jgi:glycosyltransferase involved in cell wall biosynthesis
MTRPLQVVVAHKGAREHFLAARALHRRGALAALVTDWYAPPSTAPLRRLPGLGRTMARALGATAPDLPRDRVIALNAFGLRSRWTLRQADRAGRLLEAMRDDDQRFAQRVAALPLPPHDVLFAYSYAALEALQAARARGALAVVDQIDPGRVEWDLVQEEALRWPDYAQPEPAPAPGYYERAQAEWRAADVTVVNSEWSRRALVQQGADPRHIAVLPLAYEAAPATSPPPAAGARELTVLWLGSVILRKGIPYLIEAARQLVGQPVRFLVAGPSGIRAEAQRAAPANITWLGQVPRGEAARLYQSADVFVLPTLSDGFAITQVEALAHGLPVIATLNCGDVVEDGRTGFLVPARDATALGAAITRFVRDPKLAAAMRPACLESAARFSVDAFGERLLQILHTHRKTCV